MQRWRGLASQARAEGQSLQAKRDEEAALYADQVYITYGAHVPPKYSCWLMFSCGIGFHGLHAQDAQRLMLYLYLKPCCRQAKQMLFSTTRGQCTRAEITNIQCIT